MKLWITQHSRERYIERILNGLNTSNDVNINILKQASSGKDITNKVYDECPRYILYLYEKYNELGLRIIKNESVIFITKKRKGTFGLYDILTCYYDNGKLFKQFKETALSRQDIFLKIKEIKRKLK